VSLGDEEHVASEGQVKIRAPSAKNALGTGHPHWECPRVSPTSRKSGEKRGAQLFSWNLVVRGVNR
jgi:hypothetical protein